MAMWQWRNGNGNVGGNETAAKVAGRIVAAMAAWQYCINNYCNNNEKLLMDDVW
jgi:hypothetical protein